MHEYNIYKADSLNGLPVGGVVINITSDGIMRVPFSELPEVMDKEAGMIVDALVSSLPQGVLERVASRLLQKSASLLCPPSPKDVDLEPKCLYVGLAENHSFCESDLRNFIHGLMSRVYSSYDEFREAVNALPVSACGIGVRYVKGNFIFIDRALRCRF